MKATYPCLWLLDSPILTFTSPTRNLIPAVIAIVQSEVVVLASYVHYLPWANSSTSKKPHATTTSDTSY